jgi:hypothetical protein
VKEVGVDGNVLGALGATVGAMVVVTCARDVVDVERSPLTAGTPELDLAPPSRLMAATTPTAATIMTRTTTAATTRSRFRDRPARGVAPEAAAVAGTTPESDSVRASGSVGNAPELSELKAASSKAAIRSASACVAAVLELPARVAGSALTLDGNSHSVSGSASSESGPESASLAMGNRIHQRRYRVDNLDESLSSFDAPALLIDTLLDAARACGVRGV